MEQFIKIAANDVKSLRKSDVYRVLEQNSVVIRCELAAYIASNRPDLAEEVSECLEDM